MNLNELKKVAQALVQPGKGILAADESTGTIGKRFDNINVENTEENRQAWREVLFTASEIGKYISGVIMYDETIRQSTKDGRKFVSVLENADVFPGIKVDQGTVAQENSPNEKVTTGMEGLSKRLEGYVSLGAKFTKWRAVITIDEEQNLPTEENLIKNTQDLAKYAKLSQEAGLVPMVEPEVLMDGSHSLEKCREVTEKTLRLLFEELKNTEVEMEAVILKSNMIVPGKKSSQEATPSEIAQATVDLFKEVLPKKLPGAAFLSGGQSEIEATENLNAMHELGTLPWQLNFSYGRALQESSLKAWSGKEENVTAAQKVLIHRARMNSLATLGKYSPETERL